MMIKAKTPVIIKRDWRLICSSILIGFAHCVCIILLLISGITIILRYTDLMLSYSVSAAQLLQLNYSLPIFTGSAVFLFLYSSKVSDLIKKWLHVKTVEPLFK